MGRVVTINSATLVNKGLELIEAALLFGIDFADIEVVVHPQSVVHLMVESLRRLHDRPVFTTGHEAADRPGIVLARATR